MFKMKIRGKKGAVIGEFVTWFVAFVLIVFISIILLTTTKILSVQREIPIFGEGRDEIILTEGNFGNLDSQRILVSYLNSRVERDGEEVMVKDLIAEVLEGVWGKLR